MPETAPDPIADSDDSSQILARYKQEIAYYEKETQSWDEKGRKIIRRYKDERGKSESRHAKFNILYSNTQTLLPAIYGKNPKADIERRFKDKDPLGRVTSDILERCTDYFVDTDNFRSAMRSALLDRLLPGRGTTWTRYVPHFRDIEPDDTTQEQGDLEITTNESIEEVYNEEVDTDYVGWGDFGHNWGRTWDEIYLGWRKVFLSRKELVKRFGKDIAALIPLDYTPKGLNDQKKDTAIKKAVIYECWDDQEKMVRWVHKDVDQFLDEKEDPLKLPDFFPFPKPLYSILANDSVIPVPDYVEYQDQAYELDELTARIASITKSIKVAGVYDASAEGLDRLLSEGLENKLIPVKQWAVLSEKGGMKGVISLLPIQEIAQVLLSLYEARDKVKADLYEITGIADIIRGGGDPNETATGVNQKSKFATLRLSDAQAEMARFARDNVRNVANIIASHFSIDTIKKISGIKLLTDAEKQQLQMQMQPPMAQPGQPPAAPPPIPDDIKELLDNPTWEQVEQLLRDEPQLCFKIDIEIDSTIGMDEQQEKADTVEFLRATGEFMAQMKDAPAVAQPLLAHLLMFGVRKFKIGKEVEGQFSIFAEKLEKNADAPQPPSPEQQKLQAAQQQMQQEYQFKMQQMQAENQMQRENDARDQQREQANAANSAAIQQQKADRDYQIKIAEMKQDYELKTQQMRMDAEIDMKKHAMTAQSDAKPAIQLDTNALTETGKNIKAMADTLLQSHAASQDLLKKSVEELRSKPRTVKMQGRDGRMLTAMVE